MELQRITNDFSNIPFDDITSFGHRMMLKDKVFTVSWHLGRFCNYSCSYCWTHGRSDINDHRPTDVLISTMDEIKRQARENGFNSFSFSFAGGEPTLHKGYIDLLKHYADDDNSNLQISHMTTNMSPGLRWFEKYVNATSSLDKQYVTGSWHREFGDKEKFAERGIFLKESGINFTINIVMIPSLFWVLYDEALYFQSKGLDVTLKPQSDPTACFIVDGYTDSMKEIMQQEMPQTENEILMTDSNGTVWDFDQAERFNAYDFNKFKGWTCNAGFQSIVIKEPDGSIRRSFSCRDEPLGYIDKGFKLFEKPQKCITERCVSSVDSKIPKVKT